MAQKISRKVIKHGLKHDEFVETAFDIGQWAEEHWKKVAMAAGAVVVIGLLVMAVLSWRNHRMGEATRLFGEGFILYDEASRSTGLEAVGLSADDSTRYQDALQAFEAAGKKAGSSPLADVASLYRGIVQLRAGNATEAVTILEELAAKTSDPTVTGTARANLAKAYEAAGQGEQAVEQWRQIADDPNGFFPPAVALLNAGIILTEQGRADEARTVLEDLTDRFPATAAAGEARGMLGTEPGF